MFYDAGVAISEFNSKSFVGISGGEPFLDKKNMLNLLEYLDAANCVTPLHILTNGRVFSDISYCRKFKESLKGREVLLGIPIYSLVSSVHDELVGSRGAWAETVKGLINLSAFGVPIELRFIPMKANYLELASIVEYSARIFSSVVTISVMNLEPKGWARKNWSEIYLKPSSYMDQLQEAAKISVWHGVDLSLFNYTLCSLHKSLWRFSCKSISDWKNSYLSECDKCDMKSSCCGFFSWINDSFMEQPRAIKCQ